MQVENPAFITSRKDLEPITDFSEKEFASLLLCHNPNLKIIHEPREFSWTNENGGYEGTLPDFYIYNPKGVNKQGIYVEITCCINNGTDPKGRQKRVMRNAAADQRYVVLYRSNLQKIQEAHPNVHIFDENGNKILKKINGKYCSDGYNGKV